MPALKMKTATSLICSREGSGLGVCQYSSKISKNSCSQVRISLQTDDLQSSTRSNEDVSSNIESSSSENECGEALDPDIFDGEIYHCRNSPLSGFGPSDIVEFLPDACSSDYETIFSPVFESVEHHNQWDFHNHAALDNGHTDTAHPKDDDDNGSSGSCDYEACNVLDLRISDLIVAGLAFGRTEEFNETIQLDPFPNQEYLERDMAFDMAGRYMMLPFLEETEENSNTRNGDSCELVSMNSYDACLYLAIHQMNYFDQESEVNRHSFYPDEVDGCDPQIYIGNVSELSDMVPASCLTLLPKESRKRKLVTLILDLDETLVHSTLDKCINADFTFPVFFNMKEHTVYVRRRPHLQTFLERVAEMFEIIIFTASQSTYAEKLLDILDPEDKLISKRAYRESCILSDGTYTKDLTVLGVDLAKAAIVDNSPQVFQLQVNNGIPIKSWFDDPSDSALISLLPFLETLVDAEDVRPLIEKRFSSKE